MLPDGGGDEEKLTHDMAPSTAPVMLDTVSREPEPVASMHERPSDAFLASAEFPQATPKRAMAIKRIPPHPRRLSSALRKLHQ